MTRAAVLGLLLAAAAALVALLIARKPHPWDEPKRRKPNANDEYVSRLVWEDLMATPGFNEGMARAKADFEAGQTVPWSVLRERLLRKTEPDSPRRSSCDVDDEPMDGIQPADPVTLKEARRD